jgi:hypothetical protein
MSSLLVGRLYARRVPIGRFSQNGTGVIETKVFAVGLGLVVVGSEYEKLYEMSVGF